MYRKIAFVMCLGIAHTNYSADQTVKAPGGNWWDDEMTEEEEKKLIQQGAALSLDGDQDPEGQMLSLESSVRLVTIEHPGDDAVRVVRVTTSQGLTHSDEGLAASTEDVSGGDKNEGSDQDEPEKTIVQIAGEAVAGALETLRMCSIQ